MSTPMYDDHDPEVAEESARLGPEPDELTGDGTEESAYYSESAKAPLSKGTVVLFIVLGIAGIATYFMYVRSGTQSAAAATDVRSQQVIQQFMTDRDRNFAQMNKMLKDTDAVVKQFLKYPSVTQIPLSDLRTNPFRVTAATPAGDTTSRKDEEKEKKRREEERVAVLKSVQSLQLQSVIHSDAHKACMINNTLYTEGQQVESFTVEKISPNSIIVRNGSYRFELRMQR